MWIKKYQSLTLTANATPVIVVCTNQTTSLFQPTEFYDWHIGMRWCSRLNCSPNSEWYLHHPLVWFRLKVCEWTDPDTVSIVRCDELQCSLRIAMITLTIQQNWSSTFHWCQHWYFVVVDNHTTVHIHMYPFWMFCNKHNSVIYTLFEPWMLQSSIQCNFRTQICSKTISVIHFLRWWRISIQEYRYSSSIVARNSGHANQFYFDHLSNIVSNALSWLRRRFYSDGHDGFHFLLLILFFWNFHLNQTHLWIFWKFDIWWFGFQIIGVQQESCLSSVK